ncbi:MAG: hypothetical protein KA099_05290 [Alphaproteobacteria bacterium]|nr:hypothetical protein [Alphaproteobacteria bacterium]MBP7759875.1 hypothetical protein [Alphaproteobacteria bacterium]MBP7763195.1 hypothetical protein [Alphaproteobacteria bacterium]MBP7904727.1 hypothetical protein [Alphaproteobacteria bacterium]
MAEQIADKYNPNELNAAVGLAARLQAGTITEGSFLKVTLPGTRETVDLKVLKVGKIDPDILAASEMVDPKTQDRPPMPGMLLDYSPIAGPAAAGASNTVAVTFNPTEKIPAASAGALRNLNVIPDLVDSYVTKFGSNEIPRMNLKFSYGDKLPEVLPATREEFKTIGMDAAAAAVPAAAPAGTQPAPAPVR